MSGATEGVVLGILHYGGINTACTEVGQSGAKRFSIEDEWCARARPRRAHDGWVGPSEARRRCWISRTQSIRLVHTWAWRADEKRSCVIYKTTERGSDSERVAGKVICVTCRSPRSSTRSSLCLKAANTQGLHEASQRLSSTISTKLFSFPAWVFAYQLPPAANPLEESTRVQ